MLTFNLPSSTPQPRDAEILLQTSLYGPASMGALWKLVVFFLDTSEFLGLFRVIWGGGLMFSFPPLPNPIPPPLFFLFAQRMVPTPFFFCFLATDFVKGRAVKCPFLFSVHGQQPGADLRGGNRGHGLEPHHHPWVGAAPSPRQKKGRRCPSQPFPWRGGARCGQWMVLVTPVGQAKEPTWGVEGADATHEQTWSR